MIKSMFKLAFSKEYVHYKQKKTYFPKNLMSSADLPPASLKKNQAFSLPTCWGVDIFLKLFTAE